MCLHQTYTHTYTYKKKKTYDILSNIYITYIMYIEETGCTFLKRGLAKSRAMMCLTTSRLESLFARRYPLCLSLALSRARVRARSVSFALFLSLPPPLSLLISFSLSRNDVFDNGRLDLLYTQRYPLCLSLLHSLVLARSPSLFLILSIPPSFTHKHILSRALSRNDMFDVWYHVV